MNIHGLVKLITITFALAVVVHLSVSPILAQCCFNLGSRTECGSGNVCSDRSGQPPCSEANPGAGAGLPFYCEPLAVGEADFRIPNYFDVAGPGGSVKGFLLGGIDSIGAIVTAALPYVYAIAGLLLFAYLLYGGFHLVTSFGSPKAILEAWLIIFRAVVGFIMIFASFWLIQIVERVFGLDII